MSVEELKKQCIPEVQSELGLYLNGKRLKEGDTLSSYEFEDGDFLEKAIHVSVVLATGKR